MRDLPPCEGVRHEQVIVGGVRLHVALAGPEDGPAVVLLHGWPQHWWLWRDVIGPLAADGHRVIAPDLRGFGWSEITPDGYEKEQFATDVLGLLDALGVDEFDLFGHDWGGWTAQLIALGAPARVRRLGILNIPHVWGARKGFTPRDLHRFVYQPLVAAPGLGLLVQRGALLWFFLRRAGMTPLAVREFRAAFRAPGRALAGSKVYRAFLLREAPQLLRGDDERRFAMPVRALLGLEDPAIRRPMLDGLEDHADDVRIDEVPGAGHFIVDEQPERVTAWIRGVLAEPARADAAAPVAAG